MTVYPTYVAFNLIRKDIVHKDLRFYAKHTHMFTMSTRHLSCTLFIAILLVFFSLPLHSMLYRCRPQNQHNCCRRTSEGPNKLKAMYHCILVRKCHTVETSERARAIFFDALTHSMHTNGCSLPPHPVVCEKRSAAYSRPSEARETT